jgi:hypothetical protein
MKTLNLGLFLLLICFCHSAFGAQVCEIELIDGSAIRGEMISHNEGIYVVKSQSLGILKVKESEIGVIRFISQGSERPGKKGTAAGSERKVSPEIESLQKSMMQDPAVMEKVMTLQNDPQMQELLRDPEFMNAINSGDISTLMSNPKFLELLNNPQIKEIQKKVLTP